MSAFTAFQGALLPLQGRKLQSHRCRSAQHTCYAATDPLLLRVARGEGVIAKALGMNQPVLLVYIGLNCMPYATR